MSPLAIALHRFGLGARAGEPLPGNPKAWLHGQIAAYDPYPAELSGQDYGAEATRMAMARRAARFAARRDLRAEDVSSEERRFEEILRGQREELRGAYAADVGRRLRTATASAVPFMERLVHFWSNHFAVSVKAAMMADMAGHYEFGAIRPAVGGRFADLVKAACLHPVMLVYLDQHKSAGPNSPLLKRRKLRGITGLNENLGREILELHTLGVSGGYTQEDVLELSRALTGWVGIAGNGARGLAPMPGGALFRGDMHEPGERVVMGRRYPADGANQALAILDDLAIHPATARHVSTKLARHFAGDEPPQAMIARLETRFLETGGDLPALHAALIDSPEAWVPARAKVRQPFEWLAALLRAADSAPLPDQRLANLLDMLAQPVWGPPSPAGWDDLAGSWLAPDALLRRVEVAEIVARRSRSEDVRALAAEMFPDALSPATRDAIRSAESNPMALALLAVSPEMLRR